MPKLIIVKEKPQPKGNKEILHDANDIFSTSPESKQESRMLTKEEQIKKGRPHGGKYR